jgi:predicted nucleotidyltransferase component of viral defense system
VACYCIEEIIAEKLRTLLQTHEKLVTRGWNRPRSRDYYDLWRILTEFGDAFMPGKVLGILDRKNAHRNVSFRGPDDFFSKELVSEASRNWENSLDAFVIDLPEFDQVMKELKPLVQKLLGGS